MGAVNADTNKVNHVKNQVSGQWDTIPNVARQYKESNQSWIVIADENYGEGYIYI